MSDESRPPEIPASTLMENLGAFFWAVDRELRYIAINAMTRRVIESFIGREVQVGEPAIIPELPPATTEPWREHYRRAFAGESFHFETPVDVPGGAAVEYSVAPIVGAGGAIVGATVVGQDVSDRYRDREKLKRLLHAVEQSPAAIVMTDTAGNITYVNPAFTANTGYSFEEVRGRNPRVLKSGETGPETYAELWRTISGGGIWRGELLNRKKDGELFWESAQISPVLDPDGTVTGYIAIKDDITARKALEEQLRQAQKMEAIGRLAGGVAHDFNNLLLVIRANAGLIRDEMRPGQSRDLVSEIAAAAERASNLTRQLLAFSRRQVLQTKRIDAGEVIANLGKMLARLIGEDIALSITHGTALPAVEADPTQLEQVIVNLAVNARDAMPQGGRLEIDVTATPDRSSVVLSVRDTGTGMDEKVRERIFEPFFSTKEVGKGTGLGLATVHGIVEQMGGRIEVESRLGEGTTFRIHFPAVAGQVVRAEPPPAPERPAAPPANGRTILLVEDDPAIRRVVSTIIKRAGFTTICANDASSALDASATHTGAIDLLLTDLVMPGESGAVLAERLRAQRPGIRVTFMSGYTDDAMARHGICAGEAAFIQKPFTADALLAKLNEILAVPTHGEAPRR